MKFGLNIRNKITGADLYLKLFQISAVLPVLYILVLSGYPSIITRKSFAGFIFEIGISLLPRAESLLVSFLYKSRLSEMLAAFIPLIIALIYGIIANKLVKKDDKISRTVHIVFIVLIAVDLAVRLIPLSFNSKSGLAVWIITFLIRALCLVFNILDLHFYKKQKRS